jgi:outer membrane protein
MSEVNTVSPMAGLARRTSWVSLALCACLLLTFAQDAPAQEQPQQALSLGECIRVALESNPQMDASRQSVVSARAGVTRTRSSYYPQLSLSVVEGLMGGQSSSGVGGRASGFERSDTAESLDLDLGMTLWRSGRKDYVAESRSSLEAAEMSHVNTMQALAEQVAIDYYGVLASRELVAVAQAGVEASEQHLHEVQTRIDLGDAAEVDIFTAEDDLAQAQLDLIDARSGVRSAVAQLKATMGVPYAADLQIAAAPMTVREDLPSLQQAVDTALEMRPDVLASRATVQARRYGLKQAKIERGPTLEVGGQHSLGYAGWEDRDPSWNVLASVSWPIFDGEATKADETSARAALRVAEADLRQLGNRLARDIENALIEVERTRERIAATGKSLAAADARHRAAQTKYRRDVGILLEVTDARAALTNAAANEVRARFDHQVAVVALQRATGTLPMPGAEAAQAGERDDDRDQ